MQHGSEYNRSEAVLLPLIRENVVFLSDEDQKQHGSECNLSKTVLLLVIERILYVFYLTNTRSCSATNRKKEFRTFISH